MNCYKTFPQTNTGNSKYRHVMAGLELYFGDPRDPVTAIYLVILIFVSRRKSMLSEHKFEIFCVIYLDLGVFSLI